MVSRQISFDKEQLQITFSGLTAVAGLKHKITIPYAAIKNVEAGNFHLHWAAIRVGGTSIPFGGYKAGRFRHKGETYFLSYNDPSKVVILDLEGHDYSKVVVQVGKPKEIKNAVFKRCTNLKE